MATIIDLNGDAEILTGYDGIQRTRRVNGEKEIDFTLHLTEQNEHYFHDIGEVWKIQHGGLTYVVDMISDQSDGDSYTRKIGAVQDFYWNLRNMYRYDSFSGSRTFTDMMRFIFNGTGYQFNITGGTFYAHDFENFGDDSVLALLTKALERYQAEFEVTGKTVTLKPRVGNVTDFQYRYQFNINSVTREKDAVDFSTYGEGFGKGGLHVTYTSPLADVFGKLEAPAVRDERFTQKDTLLARVKQLVDSSLNVSITFDFEDLRASGYPNNVPNEGDTVLLFDERMNIAVDTRIVEIVELFDEDENIVSCDVTLSNFSNFQTQEKRMQKATKAVADAIDGKRPLPFEALDLAVQQATLDLQSAQTELVFENGIIAVEKTDPNKLVLFNSAGLGISSDGGATFRTAITGSGIVADAVTAGTLRGILIEGVEIVGSTIKSSDRRSSFTVQGGKLRLDNADGSYMLMDSVGYEYYDRFGEISFVANRGIVTSNQFGTAEYNVYLASGAGDELPDRKGETRSISYESINGDGEIDSYVYTPIRSAGFKGNYLEVNNAKTENADGNMYIRTLSGKELRVVRTNTNDDYQAIRARTIYANNYTPSTGDNIYLGVDGTAEVRVTDSNFSNDGNPNYMDIRVNNVMTASSEQFKQDIIPWCGDALAMITNSKLYTWRRKTDVARDITDKYYRGLVVERETPKEVIDGKGINQYEMNTMSWRAIQQLNARIDGTNSAVSTMSTIVDGTNSSISALSGKVDTFGTTIANQTQQLSQFQTKLAAVDTLSSQVSGLSTTVNGYDTRITNVSNALGTTNNNVTSLVNRVTALEQRPLAPIKYVGTSKKTTQQIEYEAAVITDANGVATLYPTTDGTAAGTAIFKTIHSVNATAEFNTSDATVVRLAGVKAVATDNKRVDINVVRGQMITLLGLTPTTGMGGQGVKVYVTIHGE